MFIFVGDMEESSVYRITLLLSHVVSNWCNLSLCYTPKSLTIQLCALLGTFTHWRRVSDFHFYENLVAANLATRLAL